MNKLSIYRSVRWVAMTTTVFLAACTVTPPPSAPASVATEPAAPVHPECKPAAAGNQISGNWLSKYKQQGVAGELRVLFTLQADGKMAYTEQVKRPSKPSQGLSESGCWTQQGNQLVLSTQESNGVQTEPGDPIYQNTYTVLSLAGDKLELRTAEGIVYKLTRMSPGYRLPF